MSELKPCPFCGGEAGVNRVPFIGRYEPIAYGHIVECDRCWAKTGYYASRDKAIDAWNTRAEQTCAESGSDTRIIYVVETCEELLDGPYIEPTCYRNREDAIRRCESQNYTDGDGIRHWAVFKALKVVGE